MDDFLKAIISFPKQLKPVFPLSQKIQARGKKPDGIIICGVGGSALAGETIKALIPELNIPVPIIVWKNYDLPYHFFRNPLLIFVSFSGNTEETISSFNKTKKYKLKAVITSGGRLQKLARKENCPLIIIPQEKLLSRQAVGYMLFAELKILKDFFPQIKIPNIKLDVYKSKVEGQKLARKINRKIPLIYASRQNYFLAHYWKVNFNETASLPAFCHFLPELSHNEIAGFSQKKVNKNFFAVFLIDRSDSDRIKKKSLVTQKFLKRKGVDSIIIKGKDSRVKNTFTSFVLSNWTSYWLAKLKKIDPNSGNRIIEEFKKMTAKT